MSMFLLDRLSANFKKFSKRNAFFIDGTYYTYEQLEQEIISIQGLILAQIPDDEKYIAVFTHNDIHSYATILALWYSGKAFVPLNPLSPIDRNVDILAQTGIVSVFNSIDPSEEISLAFAGRQIFVSHSLPAKSNELVLRSVDEDSDSYLLFTSGSTGSPKGVPISWTGFNAFLSSYVDTGYLINEEDRFLQLYDLSFDGSIPCYTVPLLFASCVYTVPQNTIKYLYALKLLRDHDLTFAKMPPSTLAYIKPYFKDLRLPFLRYCILGGEACSEALIAQWSECVPQAKIQNIYGPTEATISTHLYDWSVEKKKCAHGIVSIGKCFGDSLAMVVGDDLKSLPESEVGELCLSGPQLTRGYWKQPELDALSFFNCYYKGENRRFYRTGDLAFIDEEGDFMFVGRKDTQVQIQGYRVELGELENHARVFLQQSNVAAIAKKIDESIHELVLFIENSEGKEKELEKYLISKLPTYFLPKQIINVNDFPKSAGGKINKSALKELLNHDLG